jgi:hypothetical protein
MCDGYIFLGAYVQNFQKDMKKSLTIYDDGIYNCKVQWKKMEIISRRNKVRYRLGQIGRKK